MKDILREYFRNMTSLKLKLIIALALSIALFAYKVSN